jgi:hypothetical protein
MEDHCGKVAARAWESLTSASPGDWHMVDPVFKLVQVSAGAAAAVGAAAIATETAPVTNAGVMYFSPIRMVAFFLSGLGRRRRGRRGRGRPGAGGGWR